MSTGHSERAMAEERLAPVLPRSLARHARRPATELGLLPEVVQGASQGQLLAVGALRVGRSALRHGRPSAPALGEREIHPQRSRP